MEDFINLILEPLKELFLKFKVFLPNLLAMLVILVIGQKKDILLGHPDHPANLESLTGRKITDVPLRDPLTMKPLPK